MNGFQRACALALMAAAICGAAGDALAARSSLPVSTTALITSGEGESRVLLDFGSLGDLANEWISSAHVVVSLTGMTPSADMELYLYSVGEAWRGRAPTWTFPWEQPGGDLRDWDGTSVPMREGVPVGRVRFDVTEAVRTAVESPEDAHGFLLTPLGRTRQGFLPEEVGRGGPPAASLEVSYRKVTALGMSDGGRQRVERKRASRARIDTERPR